MNAKKARVQMKHHFDVLNNEVLQGDEVLYMEIGYRNFAKGIVEKLANQSALIKHGKEHPRQRYKQIVSLSALKRKYSKESEGA